MSPERSRRGRQRGKQQPSATKAGKAKGKAQGNRGRKGGIDPRQPFWENPEAEAAMAAITGQVHPAGDPTAVVRSLGPPPLGKYADNAHHYYAAVYEKAQRLALAMATANGVLVVDGSDDDVVDGSAGEGPDMTVPTP